MGIIAVPSFGAGVVCSLATYGTYLYNGWIQHGCCIMFSVDEQCTMVELLHSLSRDLRKLKEWF